MTRVAVIGRGFGARVHVPAWELAGAEVAGVAGREGWRELVAHPGVEIVSVATPPAAHAEVALAALAAGRAVLCEKPLAATLPEAEAMAAAGGGGGGRGGGRTAVNFSYRAVPAFARLKELVTQSYKPGTLALEIEWTTDSRLRTAGPSWKDEPLQGGALSAYGVHALDYATWILGPAEVEAASVEGDEDAAEVTLRHESGARTRIEVSLVEPRRVHRLSAGPLVLENADPADPVRSFTLTHDGRAVEVPQPELRAAPDADGRIEPLAAHARRFLQALASDETFEPSFADGLRAQRLLDAVRRAAR